MKHDFFPAIDMFTNKLMSLQMIADTFGVSKTAIHKFLRKNGIDTSKRKFQATCHTCKKTFLKPRCQIRNTNHQFCSRECYHSWINNPNYHEHRQGCRIARQVLESHVGFIFDWLPHHVDGNQDNNLISNLWAFKTQSDHMKYHRGVKSLALIGSTRVWQEVIKPDP